MWEEAVSRPSLFSVGNQVYKFIFDFLSLTLPHLSLSGSHFKHPSRPGASGGGRLALLLICPQVPEASS